MRHIVIAAATMAMTLTSTIAFAENPNWGRAMHQAASQDAAGEPLDMQTTGSIKPIYENPVSHISTLADQVKKSLADENNGDAHQRR